MMGVCVCVCVCVHARMRASVCACTRTLSHVQLFVTPWTVAHQARLSMEVSRQESWSGLPFPPPGHLPDPGMEPVPLASPTLAGRFITTLPPGKHHNGIGALIKRDKN